MTQEIEKREEENPPKRTLRTLIDPEIVAQMPTGHLTFVEAKRPSFWELLKRSWERA